VTAPRAQIKVCPACGRATKGPFPEEVTHAVPYGPRVHTWASYFTTQPHRPVERTTVRCADLGQHRGSEAPVWQAAEHWDRGIAPSTAAVQGLWRPAEGLPVDESGLRVTGKWHRLHVAGTERRTSYEVHAQRGHEAMDDAGMLGACRGTAVHDHWQPYWKYDACDQALCHAPYLRALRFIDQQYQQTWAHDMAALLLEITAAGEATPELTRSLAPPALEAVAQR
jgi:transposase